MGTDKVKVMPSVNKYVWATGIRKTPKRIRVQLSRKKDDEEDSDEMVTYVDLVEVASFKGLLSENN